jgi:hypothetical protein
VHNCFKIPAGVSLARFIAQAVFLTNGNGFRQLLLQRKSPMGSAFEFFPGSPIQNTCAVSGTTTDLSFSSAVLPVMEGECYALQPYQNSGGNVSVSGGTGTFFGMEVIS